jgi:hypothetical protein
MGDIRVFCSHALRGSHALQHNFQLCITQEVRSLESPDKHSLFVAVMPLRH